MDYYVSSLLSKDPDWELMEGMIMPESQQGKD